MCSTTRGWPKRWCKRPSSSSASRPGTTTPAGARCGAGCSRWPSRPLTTLPGAPRPGRSCRSRTSSCRPSTTPWTRRSPFSTVDQALDKLPSIYGDVMRLVRRRLHSQRDRRASRHPDRHRQVPDGQGSRHVAGRTGQPARWRRCFLSREIERPIPRPSTSSSATCPPPSGPSFNRHLSELPLLPGHRRRVQRHRQDHQAAFRRTSSPPPNSKSERSPRWSLPWPSSGPSQISRPTRRTRPPPGSTRFPAPASAEPPDPDSAGSQLEPAADDTEVRPSPVTDPPHQPSPDRPTVSRLPVWRRQPRRFAAVVAAAAALIIAAIVLPLSRWARRGRRRHFASRHRCGQGQRLRSSQRAGHGPAGCLRKLGHHDDGGSPQELRRQPVVPVLVREPKRSTRGVRGHVPGADSGSRTFSMTSAVDPRDFPTMEIRIGPPSKTGALAGPVILSGQVPL